MPVRPIGVSPVESVWKKELEAHSPPRQGACATMKRATLILVTLLALVVRARDKKKVDVSKINGRIQFVQSFPDYKVQAVTSLLDLRVEIVKSFSDSPGQWQIVESFPDYKIEMVDSFPDFTIEFVTSFPGPAK